MPAIYAASKGPHDNGGSSPKSPEEKLLERIRRRFDYMTQAWREIREKAQLDMRALSDEGPWDPADRAERIKNKRPCIHLDQLEQYPNALVNEVRQNPLAIKVTPDGDGTNDETAELVGDRIRQIEYESNATQAYRTAFECAVQRSYGAFGAQIDYKSWDSFDLIIKMRRFPNPEAVIWDPNCKEADASDMEDAFVLERIDREQFPEKFKGATITSFGSEHLMAAPNWFGVNDIQVAEYWYKDQQPERLFLVETPEGQQKFLGSEIHGYKATKDRLTLKDGTVYPLVDWRATYAVVVKQCLTNGVEILSESEIPGKWIPIFPVIGKEKYVREGDTVKRVLESYIRKAIDAQMLFDFYKTNEAEEVGQTPKAPFWMYEGQDEGQEDVLASINRVPRAYATVKAQTEGTPQNVVLPLPQRIPKEPQIQALEIGAEAARRAIQAAVGSYGYTRLDDTNVKSGKAINLLDRQSDMGSYHFIDNYKASIAHAGRVIGSWLPVVESGQRSVGIRKKDGSHNVIKLNVKYRDEKSGKMVYHRYRTNQTGEHQYTVSTGPSYNSQREAATAFADTLAQSSEIFPMIGDLVVKLKDLGPIGDEIAERLHKMLPPQLQKQEGQAEIPPQVEQELQQMGQMIERLTAALNEAQDQLQSKKLEVDSKEKIEGAKLELQRDIETARIELEKMKLKVEKDIAQLKARTELTKTHEQLSTQENLAEHAAQNTSHQGDN
jgi:hypothetical protein